MKPTSARRIFSLAFGRRAVVLLCGGAACLTLTACVTHAPRPAPVIVPAPVPSPTTGSLAVYVTRGDGTPLAGAAIYLQALGIGTETLAAAPASSHTIDLIDRQFQPHVLIVHDGGAVVFNNLDDVEHQIYSFSIDPPLNLDLRPGQSQRVTMPDHATVVALGCKIYNAMLAYAVVTDATVFGTADAGGFVRFSDVSPGHYRVRLWYADPRNGMRSELATTVTVASGREQLVRFTLR